MWYQQHITVILTFFHFGADVSIPVRRGTFHIINIILSLLFFTGAIYAGAPKWKDAWLAAMYMNSQKQKKNRTKTKKKFYKNKKKILQKQKKNFYKKTNFFFYKNKKGNKDSHEKTTRSMDFGFLVHFHGSFSKIVLWHVPKRICCTTCFDWLLHHLFG